VCLCVWFRKQNCKIQRKSQQNKHLTCSFNNKCRTSNNCFHWQWQNILGKNNKSHGMTTSQSILYYYIYEICINMFSVLSSIQKGLCFTKELVYFQIHHIFSEFWAKDYVHLIHCILIISTKVNLT